MNKKTNAAVKEPSTRENPTIKERGTVLRSERPAVSGALILRLLGVLFGTWMGLEYGRDWGCSPTPLAVLAFWATFALPVSLVGAIIGGIWGAARGSE